MNTPNPNPSQEPFSQSSPFEAAHVPVAELAGDERLDFIRKTYSCFLGGIFVSILSAAATMSVPSLYNASQMLWSMPIISILLLFGLVFGAGAVSRVPGVNIVALGLFTAFIGWWLTPMLVTVNAAVPGVVTQAGVLSALTFGALTGYAFVSKKDFSFLHGMLWVGLIALIGGGLLNIFIFKSSAASYFMAWGTLLLFSGFVLYDTSNILRTHDRDSYVSAALDLYLDFLNIFLAILRILTGNSDD